MFWYIKMLSDSIFEAIDDILKAVFTYNDYSELHKRRIVLALAHLYMIQWRLDRFGSDFNSSFTHAQRYASEQFENALAGRLNEQLMRIPNED